MYLLHKKLLNKVFRNILFILMIAVALFPLCLEKAALAKEDPLFKVRGIGGGGGLYSPVISPYDENLLFVACDMGGVYRSTDKGKSWRMLHWENTPTQADDAPPPIFLSKNRITWVREYFQIVISENAGQTWKDLSSGPWAEVSGEKGSRKVRRIISFLPLNEQASSFLVSSNFGFWRGLGKKWTQISSKPVQFIQTIGDAIYALEDGTHLLKSKDQGLTFERITLPGKATAFKGVVTDDGQSLFYISINGEGIFSSVDLGQTWKLRTSECEFIGHFIIPEGQLDIAYAMQYRHDNTASIFRTLDGGENWENVFRMHESQETFWQDINVQNSWLQTNLHWSYYFTYHGLSVSPFDPKTLLAATQGELFISRNGGDTWETFFAENLPPYEGDTVPRTKSVGLEVTSVWGYHFDPHDPKRHYIAYTDVGFARSLDQGETWAWAAKGSPWKNTFYDIAFDPNIPGKMYAATSRLHDIPHFMCITKVYPENQGHQGGLVVSTDYGKTWSVPYAKSAKQDKLPLQVCTSVIIDPTSPPEKRTLYAGVFGESDDASGVYVSHDDGKTWKATATQPGGYNRHIYKIRIHPTTGDLYVLITGLRAPDPHFHKMDEGGIWVSSDKGNTWRHISKGSKLGHWATAMAFHPTNPDGLYVTAASPQGLGGGGLYFTRDGGKKWWNILPDKQIKRLTGLKRTYDHWMAVTVHPQKSDIIFVGASINGVFFSTNGGKSWKHCREFPFANAQSITYNPKNLDEVIITTFGSGIWSTSLKELFKKYDISYDKIK